MASNDPFASITDLCHVSSSQEEQLDGCSFALEPTGADNSAAAPASPPSSSSLSGVDEDNCVEIPVDATGIVMLSAPETPEWSRNDDNATYQDAVENGGVSQNGDVFLTPPERSASQEHKQQELPPASAGGNTVAASNGDDGGEWRAVDLGRDDSRLGFFSEVDPPQRIESDSAAAAVRAGEVIHCEFVEDRVLKRGLGSVDVLTVSPMKKSKILGSNLGMEAERRSLVAEAEKFVERLVKPVEYPWERCRILDSRRILEAPRCSLDAEVEDVVTRFMAELKSLKTAHPKNLVPETKKRTEDGRISGDVSNPEEIREQNGCLNTPRSNQIEEMTVEKEVGGDRRSNEQSMAKKKLKFSREVLDSVSEEIDLGIEFNECRTDGKDDEKESDVAVPTSSRLCNTEEGCTARKTTGNFEMEKVFRFCIEDCMECESSQKEDNDDNSTSDANEGHFPGKSVNDAGMHSCVDASGTNWQEKEKEAGQKRALPSSISGNENAERAQVNLEMVSCQNVYTEVSLLDVLRTLAKDRVCDPSLKTLSILEAAKMRGMTFP